MNGAPSGERNSTRHPVQFFFTLFVNVVTTKGLLLRHGDVTAGLGDMADWNERVAAPSATAVDLCYSGAVPECC